MTISGEKRVLISDPTDKICADVLIQAGVHGVRRRRFRAPRVAALAARRRANAQRAAPLDARRVQSTRSKS